MTETTLLDAQEDIYQRILADEFLAQVPVLKRDTGDIQADIADSLNTLNARSGKAGACIIILQPLADPGEGEVAGGLLRVDFTFLVLEEPITNRAGGGTALHALTIARRLVGILHLYHPRGIIGVLSMQKPAIVPTETGAPVSFEVRFEAQEEYFGETLKVATPVLNPRSGAVPQAVTITCATAGAAIYYTLDGSHPYQGNPEAELYTGAPVNVAVAGTLRAGAFKTGLIASDVNAADFS